MDETSSEIVYIINNLNEPYWSNFELVLNVSIFAAQLNQQFLYCFVLSISASGKSWK